jgi:calcineurin-like phosphoesterase
VYPVAKGPVKLHGVMVEIDETTGKATSIQRIAEIFTPS